MPDEGDLESGSGIKAYVPEHLRGKHTQQDIDVMAIEAVMEAMSAADLPIKGPALVVESLKNLFEQYRIKVLSVDIVEIIQRLVDKGELVEVEYVLPDMSDRIKSLYFQRDTRIFHRRHR